MCKDRLGYGGREGEGRDKGRKGGGGIYKGRKDR